MASSDYQVCEDRVLAHEGSGYTDGVNPYDPGGPTRWGITIFDARAFWKSNATSDDVRTMPREIAVGIYKSKYWAMVNGDALPAGVDDCVFDYGVNSGNSRSGKVLRRVLNLPDSDWHVTPLVLAECSKRDPIALINAICDERMRFLESLAIWPTYRHGWTTRVQEVRLFAIQLAGHQATPVSVPLPAPPPAPAAPTGKGTVPPPDHTIVAGGGGAATIGVTSFLHWLGAHPVISALCLAIGAVAIVVVVNILQSRYAVKKDAPTPGLIPVPVLALPKQEAPK